MKKKKWILVAISAFVAAAVAMIMVRPLRWRAHLVELKATGQIQDVSWRELGYLMAGNGVVQPAALYKTHDPYSAIFVSANPERVRFGRELFNQQCSPCHGVDARGGMAPNLTKGEFTHGGSDWAIYRTIKYGIPGTPMQPQTLGFENVWNLVTFLKDSVAKNRAIRAGADPSGTVVPQLNVTLEQIKAATSVPAEWLTYSGTYDGQRHSKLAQITRENDLLGHRESGAGF
jgi:mono/diheme cytochrome c family protein